MTHQPKFCRRRICTSTCMITALCRAAVLPRDSHWFSQVEKKHSTICSSWQILNMTTCRKASLMRATYAMDSFLPRFCEQKRDMEQPSRPFESDEMKWVISLVIFYTQGELKNGPSHILTHSFRTTLQLRNARVNRKKRHRPSFCLRGNFCYHTKMLASSQSQK